MFLMITLSIITVLLFLCFYLLMVMSFRLAKIEDAFIIICKEILGKLDDDGYDD